MTQQIFKSNWQTNVRLFLLSQFVTGITSTTVQYAIIWYLTERTESATILSFATLLGMLPMVLLNPFVGPYVDRLNKKSLLIVPDIIAAAFAIILSVTGATLGTFPIWLIFVSLFIRSVAQTFQMPTVQTIIPSITPSGALTKINGQLGIVQSANRIIAPAIGAFLFALLPLHWLLLIDVIGAILGISLLIFVTVSRNITSSHNRQVFADMKLGFSELVNNKGLWIIVLIGAISSLFIMPAASMYPLITTDYFQKTVENAGIVSVVYSVGSLAGGTIISLFGKWSDRMKPFLLSYVVIGVTLAISGFLPPNQKGFIWFVLFSALTGLAVPFFDTLLMAMVQQSYPVNQLGRIVGFTMSLLSLPGPLGLIFAGPIADSIGVEKLFIIAGVGIFFCALVNWLIKPARIYDKQLHQTMEKNNE
ncbi:MFS transporter [Tetragenococcus solitarius]|uniref:Multidrug efflux MFS transporter EfmA n=1 Tax=Tetragenococcus solitarius TaxID=71453 RepID=A0ABN3Y261_9ENTE|nr:MFS transporter [Tetragenococcus solitarius]